MSYLKPTSSATTTCSCEDVDVAERILREHLPAGHDAQSTLATLDRLSALRADEGRPRGGPRGARRA